MTLDGAIQLMVDLAPFREADLARCDLQICLRQPACGMNYTIGMVQVEELLAKSAQELERGFDLGRFHDTFRFDRAYAWLWEDST